MFPKPHRLKSLAVFRKLHQFPAIFRHDAMMVLAVPVPEYLDKPEVTEALQHAPIQFGVVISKKVHKSAVVRNKLRRQWREVIRRDVLPLLPSHGALPLKKNNTLCRAFIFIIRQQAVDTSFPQFQSAIIQAIVRNIKVDEVVS